MKNPTVFLLGAGASVPFGFPSGRTWADQIYQGLSSSSRPLAHTLHDQLGYDQSILNRFSNEFYFSGKNSIDAFLEHRQEYEQVGKAIIAATLIRYEIDSAIFSYTDENWLRYAYERLDTGFEEFGENNVSFVTFNYDRVVEWFFVTALSNSYKKDKTDCARVLKSIPIIHLHGRLGYLPWEAPADNRRDFNGLITRETLEASIKEIKVIYEDISGGRDAEFSRARKLLDDAERVYILGFGFHPTNVERLGLNKLAKKDKSRATGLGLTTKEVSDITQRVTAVAAMPVELRGERAVHRAIETDWANSSRRPVGDARSHAAAGVSERLKAPQLTPP